MKHKFSLITFLSAACIATSTILNAEGNTVAVYDASGELLAEGTSLSSVSAYLDGTQGNKVVFYADDTDTTTIKTSGDSYWEFTSEGENVRTISNSFQLSQGVLKILLDNVNLSGGVYLDKGEKLWLGGTSNLSGGISAGEITITEKSNITTDDRFSGNLVIESNVNVSASNYSFAFATGNLTIGESSTVTISNYGNDRSWSGGAYGVISGRVNIDKGGALSIVSCKYYAVTNGLVTQENTKSLFQENLSAIHGNVVIGKSSSTEFLENRHTYSSSYHSMFHPSDDTDSVYGGAVCGDVKICQDSVAVFSGNTSEFVTKVSYYVTGPIYTYGGAVYGNLQVEQGGEVCFSNNTSLSLNRGYAGKGYSYGGAVYGDIQVGNDAVVVFSKNTADANHYTFGGGCYGSVELLEGSSVTFSENLCTGGSSSYGGAIHGTLTLIGNSSAVFNKNEVNSTNRSSGGAIAGNVQIGKNAKATFSNCTATSSGEYSYGGAVYGSVLVESNAEAVFLGNVASSNSGSPGGGAIYGNVEIKEGAKAIFSNNLGGKDGGAIYAESLAFSDGFGTTYHFSGKVILAGNVTFNKNEAGLRGGAISARNVEFNTSLHSEEIVFSQNKSHTGGAIYASLTSSADSNISFSQNEAVYGGAICFLGASELAGNIQFSNNTASNLGGAIYLYDSLTFLGDTTKVVFSGNRIGSDADGWTNNDIYLTTKSGKILIQNSGLYEFGGGIDASVGGTLSISEANVIFQNSSVSRLGGVVTIANGASVTLNSGVVFDLLENAELWIESGSVLKIQTGLSEAAVISLAKGASVDFDESTKLVIDIMTASMAKSNSVLDDNVARIALIRADEGSNIGSLSNIELLLNGVAFCGEWDTAWESGTLYLTVTIPEPSTFGLLAGLGALALVGTRRRRK